MILALRTDSPQAELYIYDTATRRAEIVWEAGRLLAQDILTEIESICTQASVSLKDIEGVIVFEGPGSFTGLRIGLTVANTLAYALGIAIVAGRGDGWIEEGLMKLSNGENSGQVLPYYGADPHITLPVR